MDDGAIVFLRQALLHLFGTLSALFINGCQKSAVYNKEKGKMPGSIFTLISKPPAFSHLTCSSLLLEVKILAFKLVK